MQSWLFVRETGRAYTTIKADLREARRLYYRVRLTTSR